MKKNGIEKRLVPSFSTGKRLVKVQLFHVTVGIFHPVIKLGKVEHGGTSTIPNGPMAQWQCLVVRGMGLGMICLL